MTTCLTPDIRQLAWQTRFQIEKVTRKQSIAEHSYFVSVYADLLARAIEWKGDHGQLVRYCLYHDLDEVISGDIPTPVKASIKESPGSWSKIQAWIDAKLFSKFPWAFGLVLVDEEAKYLAKIADLLEALLYLKEEEASGNTMVSKVFAYLQNILFTMISDNKEVLLDKQDLILQFIMVALDNAKNPNQTVC